MRSLALTVLAGAALGALAALPAAAQQSVTIHPAPQQGVTEQVTPGGGLDIQFPTHNDSNYLNYGPLPDKPGSGHSQDYMDQAGGNDLDGVGVGIGADVDADIMPDSDSAYGD